MTLQPASGARDLNPQQVRKNHLIASKLSSLYQLWGYERISPPHIERLDTLMAAGGISNNEILKIVSDEPLGLRPEITASIVRAASTRFNEYERPLRFWSTGTSFKCNQSIDGGIDIEESFQSGVELIGTKAINAEIELLSLLIESLKIIEIDKEYKMTLLIGNTYLLEMILSSFDSTKIDQIKNILCDLDYIGLSKLDLKDEQRKFIKKILNMRGKPEKVLTDLENIYGSNSYIENLKELFTIIEPLAKEKGIEVQLDPTLGTKYKLYSGLTFSLVSSSPSAPVIIAKGGRYDDLVKKFSSSVHNSFGIGFSISIDKIRELVSSNEEIKGINEKVLIAYKQSESLYKALKQQKEWHKKGIISVISHEPLKTNDATNQLLKSNRCTKIEWID
ncbi:ATP phosphoribosyltransferase regulatory subunit [Prochlorococcus marinus]|uniref:ATP phosphoribosyltransferase regulatory subunit n=1 Tax=Prochlorococcus marinus XMU1408 TaxID=2213228 RepID=A0A318RH55_PROMR|nr:ATP phosphoribosyltransferase regulatory subunit [Prochlorococcus marinus]MBW3041936.1 ATP phosphoribosyltransferase regulatory subunit [Prochlorococcus marinus str. XMU1408]PYE03063.1 ATP phosphoribosyltransferase regulatory subunit [Prochlorococcus marinus XMU1408]